MKLPVIYKGFKGFVELNDKGKFFGEIHFLTKEHDHIVWRESDTVEEVLNLLKKGVDFYQKQIKNSKHREYIGI